MIRNVVMGLLADDSHEAELEAGLAGIAGLQLDGLLSMQIGRDARLRAGSWSFCIVNDWVDADAYRAYDLDEEHNRYRAIIVGACAQIARAQFEV